jgi:DUF438 domain-containing protein
MTQALAELQSAKEAADAAAILLRFRQSFNDLMDIDKHYQRKEHALWPGSHLPSQQRHHWT